MRRGSDGAIFRSPLESGPRVLEDRSDVALRDSDLVESTDVGEFFASVLQEHDGKLESQFSLKQAGFGDVVVIILNSSPKTWLVAPMPDDVKLILPDWPCRNFEKINAT
jgi:hypothetical protein